MICIETHLLKSDCYDDYLMEIFVHSTFRFIAQFLDYCQPPYRLSVRWIKAVD